MRPLKHERISASSGFHPLRGTLRTTYWTGKDCCESSILTITSLRPVTTTKQASIAFPTSSPVIEASNRLNLYVFGLKRSKKEVRRKIWAIEPRVNLACPSKHHTVGAVASFSAGFRRFVRASQEAGVGSAIRLIGKIAKPKMRNQAALNITMLTGLDPDKEDREAGPGRGVVMSQVNLLKQLIAEQGRLQFAHFDFDDAYTIGLDLVETARKAKPKITIDIAVNGQQLFHAAMPGSPDNDQWVVRKNRVVGRLFMSSYYIAKLLEDKGKSIEEVYGLPARDFAASGGAVPVTVKGSGVIGTITVSGLPHQDDHAMVVDAIRRHLKRNP